MNRIVFVALLVFVASSPANAQVKVFLDIPGIPGETQDAGFEDQIDVISWNQSVANVNNMPVVLPLVFTHNVDIATPRLIAAAIDGTVLQSATLRAVTQVPQSLEFLTIVFNNARVVSVKNGGADGGGNFIETVTLTCTTFEFIYRPIDQNGQPGGAVTANGSCGN